MKKFFPYSLITVLILVMVISFTGCGGSSGGNGVLIPTTALGTPETPTVTAADSQLTVSWTAVTGATNYEVWYGTVNDSSKAGKFGSNITATNCVINNLTNGTLYYVWLKADNDAGSSGFSQPASGTPVASVVAPAAPAAPTLAIGDGQLTVNWAAVSGATSYQVWYGTTNNSGSAGQFGADITSGIASTITGLTNGTTYYVWIIAKNSAGTSGFSPSASMAPASGTPSYPAGYQILYNLGGFSFTMIYVPGGLTFPTDYDIITIGSPTVADAYWIAEKDVTYQMWLLVYDWAKNGIGPNGTGRGQYTFANPGVKGGGSDADGGNSAGDDRQPVTQINWRDAMIWCNALTEYYNTMNGTNYACVYCTDAGYTNPIRTVNSGGMNLTAGQQDNPYVNPAAKGFRLPTKNEWELAARYKNGITWTPGNYSSGANGTNFSDYQSVAVFFVTSTATVGSLAPNALGLYDMNGNVWKYCFDWDPSHANQRVHCGGAWSYGGSMFVRIGYQGYSYPYEKTNIYGFRPVRSN